MRTPYVPVKFEQELCDQCRASAGPRPNVAGMKLKYWGKDAHVVKCGQYCYLLNKSDYDYWAARF